MADDIFKEAINLPLYQRRELIKKIRQSIENEEHVMLVKQRYEIVKQAVETVTQHELRPKSRLRIDVRSKVFIAYIMRNDGYSLTEIGERMELNHSSIFHLSRIAEDWLTLPGFYKEEVEQLKQIEELVYGSEIQEADAECSDTGEGASE